MYIIKLSEAVAGADKRHGFCAVHLITGLAEYSRKEVRKGKEEIAMTMTKVEIDVPEEIVPYTVLKDQEAQITRNAMLLYPYIKNGVMSHGKAAEMLGLRKAELITLYGKLGLPYFDETEEEFEEDLAVLKKFRGETI